MTAPYLDAMSARAAECAILADCAEDPRIARWLRTHAAEIAAWRLSAVKAERTLDYIAEDERAAAEAAESRARQQNPGRGPSPAANCPEHSAGCERPGPAHLSRTIDQAFAVAAQSRIVPFRPRPRVVLGDEMGVVE